MRLACKSKKQLNNMSQFVIEGEGEGVILRKPKSVYESGRSDSLLKLKVLLIIIMMIVIND